MISKSLKQNLKTEKIPVIAFSASQNPEYKKQLYTLGIVKYLSKPLTKTKLIIELSNHLSCTRPTVTDNTDNIEQPVIAQSLTDIEKLPELVKILKEDIIPLCKNLENTGAMNDIKIFGKRVKKIGVKFNAQTLIKYGDDINDYAQDFELYDIKAVLKAIPVMVKELDEIIAGEKNG